MIRWRLEEIIKKLAITLIYVLAIYVSSALQIANAAVMVCNNCTYAGMRQTAESAGAGIHVVADVYNRNLSGWENEWDGEFNRWMARPRTIPQSIADAFMFDTSPAMASSGGTLIVGPNMPNNSFVFPPGYGNANAYDFAINGNSRANLEKQIADYYAGATTNSQTWNNISKSLKSVALNAMQFDKVTIAIYWSDGSKTVVEIRASNTDTAKYVAGESKNESNIPIPDETADDGSVAHATYGGTWNFSSNNALLEWMSVAEAAGVRIIGDPDAYLFKKSMVCVPDGDTVACRIE